ncbi:MAG: (d)CMP kinase [Gammaproteobacteria bacterium]|jgi:cytidylate kinase|nr:(d)CMP kinase [Gammaproteobacteria bacterium]MBT3696020.1 (d)CMP kinase [Gammaproteobacteria bacterium]MBT5334286.1 (d)CMP kinase [Gammaproteobacteria bacterium]MBT5682114.1 (d)CMP kinase [Gammaproteobacteria bacterium]MBT6024648.1 (d)CMP kinase [Gammaproteobacteria bacterium]
MQHDPLAPVVTIDGPGGSGKGTLSSLVAAKLGWHLLDSGALYRIVAVSAQSQAIDLADENTLVAMVADLQIAFIGDKVDVNGSDLSDIIRTEETGVAASQVAALPGVRDAILALQKSFQRAPGLVADGRDMGTVVFPHSKAKIFLDASAEARADRRYKQLKNKGLSVNLRDLLEQIQERDARDRGRAVAPLKPAADALIIDSTQMTIEEVLETIMTEVSKGYL